VDDSEPAAEFQEMVNKSKVMPKAVALAETFSKSL
jgi:anthranilate/para-aminobenzoate synthase component I